MTLEDSPPLSPAPLFGLHVDESRGLSTHTSIDAGGRRLNRTATSVIGGNDR